MSQLFFEAKVGSSCDVQKRALGVPESQIRECDVLAFHPVTQKQELPYHELCEKD